MCNQFNAIQLCAQCTVYTQTAFCRYKFFCTNIETCNTAWFSALICLAMLCFALLSIVYFVFRSLYLFGVCFGLYRKTSCYFVWLTLTHHSLSLSLAHAHNHFCTEFILHVTPTIQNIYMYDWS